MQQSVARGMRVIASYVVAYEKLATSSRRTKSFGSMQSSAGDAP